MRWESFVVRLRFEDSEDSVKEVRLKDSVEELRRDVTIYDLRRENILSVVMHKI